MVHIVEIIGHLQVDFACVCVWEAVLVCVCVCNCGTFDSRQVIRSGGDLMTSLSTTVSISY